MDKKKTLKYVLDLSKEAKFKEALNILSSIEEEVNNKWLISFIIGCCNACVANISSLENISEDNLHQYLNYILSCIRVLNESEVLSYVQSLYYILKFLIKKKCYRLIADMEGILVPVFLSSSLPNKHIDGYLNSASLLYNFIVKTDQEDINQFVLVEICKIIPKMYVKVSNASGLLKFSFYCAAHLYRLSCSTTVLEEYLFYILSLAKLENMNVNMEEDFKMFLSFFTLVCKQIFKKFDFNEAEKFYEKTYTSAIEIFKDDDCTNSLTVLRFPLLLSPLSSMDKLENLLKCRRSLSNIENAILKQHVGIKLDALIYTIVFDYYKSGHGAEWCKNSEILRLELIQFICEISRLELLPKFMCSCKCLIGQNVYGAFSYCQHVCILLEICSRQKTVSPNFNKSGANLLVQFYEDVKLLKEYNCENWKTAWNTLGSYIYNLGVSLSHNSDQGCLQYFYNLIKYFIKLEFRDALKILKFSMVGTAFAIVCDYNSKDYKKCMAFSALGIRLCPNEGHLISRWIKSKISERDAKTVEASEIQKLTLVSAFKHFKQEIDFFTGGADLLSAADEVDLLIFELEQYKMKWKSKIPMMSVLKELHNRVDLKKFVEVITMILGDCEVILHEDVSNILQRTLRQFEEKINGEENTTPELTIFLAVLNYLHYKYCIKDTIAKNCYDIEKSMAVTQTPNEPPDAIPKDPNEECDIVSSYDCLQLNRYFSVMKYIDRSLDLFASVVKDNFDPSGFTKIKTTMIYNLLFKISMEYRLHRYKIKSLQALQLALKVAEFENDPCKIVWAISFIVENSDVNKSYVTYLNLIANKHLTNIECNSISNVKVILTYYIHKAKSLIYKDYKESFRLYEMANELYEVQTDKSELKLIKSQLHILHFKFVSLPCSFGVVDHKKSTLLTIHLAHSLVYEVYGRKPLDGAYEMSILLDTNEELAKLNHLLKCPREVRCYCRETIILSQQLVLPLRCAYYLVYLAYADLRSGRFDDSKVKIEGLGDILCLTKYYTQLDQENKPPCKEVETNIAEVTNSLQEMVLDVPESYKKQFSLSSPTLVIQPFHLPAFLNHEEDCACFYCTSLEYQGLVLEKFRLDALLNVKLNNFSISIDFFHGALNFYELCSKKYEASIDVIAKYISYDLIPEFTTEMLGIYGLTLVDYSFQLHRTNNKKEALKVTNKVIDLVYPKKIPYIYLYNDALIQKLGYLTELPDVVLKTDNTTSEMDTLFPVANVVSTTPESKHSKVTVSVQYSPNYSPPKRRVKKCLPFKLSPVSNSSNNSKPQEQTSPVLKQPKSPLPKIRIHSGRTAVQKPKITPAKKLNDESKKTKRNELDSYLSDWIKDKRPTSIAKHSVDLFESQDNCNSNSIQENTSPISKAPKTPSVRKKINSVDHVPHKNLNPTSSIHIFNDYSKKTKKKVLLNNDDFNTNSNAGVSTPVHHLDSERGLRTRTKLLTDKLRKSTKKPEVCNTDDDVGQADVPNGRKKLTSRRNLFENVNDEKELNVPHGGAIRKSTRTRKL